MAQLFLIPLKKSWFRYFTRISRVFCLFVTEEIFKARWTSYWLITFFSKLLILFLRPSEKTNHNGKEKITISVPQNAGLKKSQKCVSQLSSWPFNFKGIFHEKKTRESGTILSFSPSFLTGWLIGCVTLILTLCVTAFHTPLSFLSSYACKSQGTVYFLKCQLSSEILESLQWYKHFTKKKFLCYSRKQPELTDQCETQHVEKICLL